MTEKKYVMAIDQGTTSSRAILFDHSGQIVSVGQKEHEQIFPKAGWVEHNPIEIWDNIRSCVADALQKAQVNRHEVAAVGITNQRETVVVWDKNTGEPVYNAIVWQDTRTSQIIRELAGEEGMSSTGIFAGLTYLPIIQVPKSSGFWIMSRAHARRQKPETCCSVTPTAGYCGI